MGTTSTTTDRSHYLYILWISHMKIILTNKYSKAVQDIYIMHDSFQSKYSQFDVSVNAISPWKLISTNAFTRQGTWKENGKREKRERESCQLVLFNYKKENDNLLTSFRIIVIYS